MNPSVPLTRRDFLGRVSLIAGAAPTLCALPVLGVVPAVSPESPRSRKSVSPIPVLSIHIDQVYLDKSGTAAPYVPPAGTRSGHAVSELSDVEFLSRYGYF